MQLIRHLPATADAPTAVAIGNFDGLHLGHQAVIAQMRAAAASQGLVPSVLTFEPHPRRFFAPTSPAFRLERLRTKLERLRDAGVERVFMPRFNAAFAQLSPEAFLNEILQQRMGAKAVVVGENFAFGRDRGGDIRTLRAWGEKEKVAIVTVPPVRFGEAICSSSGIRAELAVGDVGAAAHLLGRPYMLSGRIVHGDGRGKTIGFPTANVSLSPTLKLPAYGVYAVRVEISSSLSEGGLTPPSHPRALTPAASGSPSAMQGENASVIYDGVANLGVKPTISVHNQPTLEVHLFDVMQELYGKTIFVTFVDYLRPEQKFSGLDALVSQIGLDCERAKERLSR